ncbi:hypothetical protein ACVWYN_001543 [Pedobacter sp. UYP24]
MKTSIHTLFIVILFSVFALPTRATNLRDTLNAKEFKPYGRYLLNKQGECELISSAAHFGLRFKDNQCAIYFSNAVNKGRNYIQYELDGVYQKRILVSNNADEPTIIKTNTTGWHTVWIYKATEAHTGPVIISKVTAKQITSLKTKEAPVIEFIGNSITCGAASDITDYPCGTGEYQDHHNAYLAYGPRIARALRLNYIMSSVSGIGIYRTWNTEGPSMPQVYENIDFQLNSPIKWNFSNYSPRIVSIALGTNDLSNGDGKKPRLPFDTLQFINGYVSFIKLVKSKYPKAQIALLSSPMVGGASGKILEKCLSDIKVKVDGIYLSDKPLATFFFPKMTPHGCSGHPSIEDHAVLAQQLIPFYKKLLE